MSASAAGSLTTAKLWGAATPAELARQVKESGGDKARIASSVSMASSPALQVELTDENDSDEMLTQVK